MSGPGRSPRKYCIDQDRQHHRPRSAEAIADDAETKPPAAQPRRNIEVMLAAVLFDVGLLLNRQLRGGSLFIKQLIERRDAHDVHQVLIHRVKEPTQGGDEQDDPTIAIESLIPFEPAVFCIFLSLSRSSVVGMTPRLQGKMSGRQSIIHVD